MATVTPAGVAPGRFLAESLPEPPPRPSAAPVRFAVRTRMLPDLVREMTRLRVGLEVAVTERTPRAVMLLAAQGGEGTTTVAVQLAQVLAEEARLRVLLVDAHARRPAFGPDGLPATGADGGGLLAFEPVGDRTLDLMPLPADARREGVLAAEVLRGSLQSVGGAYDWIVVDGPPVLESPDAASLGAVVDGVVLVVQAGRTKRPVLTRSVDLLRRSGGKVLGMVLNRRRLEIPEFIYRRI
jgi:Mrp family chromosome partitioning ATPase